MHKIKIPKVFVYLLAILAAALSKLIVLNILPEKFFYDSHFILQLMGNTNGWVLGNSFSNVAYLFTKINIFNLNNLTQWHIFGCCFLMPLLIFIFHKFKFSKLSDYILLLASIGLLNIFAFNLSKEFWQFIIFFIIFLIIRKEKYTIEKAVFLSASILVLWGVLFRVYYILIGAYTILALFTFKWLKYFKGSRRNKIISVLLLLIMGVMTSLLFAKLFMPAEYEKILNIHAILNYNRVGSEDAKTMIVDMIPAGNNLLLYIPNYIVNLIRMLFPLELVQGGVYYYPFIAYQILLTYRIAVLISKTVKFESSKMEQAALFVYVGYLLGSALFEPDFGTWVRHECVTFPVLAWMLFQYRPLEAKR